MDEAREEKLREREALKMIQESYRQEEDKNREQQAEVVHLIQIKHVSRNIGFTEMESWVKWHSKTHGREMTMNRACVKSRPGGCAMRKRMRCCKKKKARALAKFTRCKV